MKKSLFALMLLALSVITYAQDSNVRAVIEENNKKMLEGMMREDIDACLALYSDDVISLPSYGPLLRGKDQIAASWREDMEKGNKIKDMQFNTLEVREEGNVAIEIGTYNVTMSMKGMAQDITDQGKYITVWEKDGNDWKVAMEIWNSDINPWESKEGQTKEEGNK